MHHGRHDQLSICLHAAPSAYAWNTQQCLKMHFGTNGTMANQYPVISAENRKQAITRGDKTYISGTSCKNCDSYEKHTSSMSCAPCNIARNKYKLADVVANRDTGGRYNPTKRRRNLLRYQYKISTVEYQKILNSQNGKCAICGVAACSTGRHFAVDHDHKTKKIRGLLCCSCNQGLGQFKDDPKILMRAMNYLWQK
jgi:hypothetical protein